MNNIKYPSGCAHGGSDLKIEEMKDKSSVQEFADTIKDNPQEIIDWCISEIKEYEKLIKILKKRNYEQR